MRSDWLIGAVGLVFLALYSSKDDFVVGSRAKVPRLPLTVIDVSWSGVEPWETLRVTVRNDGIYSLRAEVRAGSRTGVTPVLSPGSEVSVELAVDTPSSPAEIQVREKLDYIHSRFDRARVTPSQRIPVPPRE